MTDKEFLDLKKRYYDGLRPGDERDRLPQAAVRQGTPGGANNKEQYAMRWAYEQAHKDMGQHIIQVLLGRKV